MITVNGKPLRQLLDDNGNYRPILQEMAKDTKKQYNSLTSEAIQDFEDRQIINQRKNEQPISVSIDELRESAQNKQ